MHLGKKKSAPGELLINMTTYTKLSTTRLCNKIVYDYRTKRTFLRFVKQVEHILGTGYQLATKSKHDLQTNVGWQKNRRMTKL